MTAGLVRHNAAEKTVKFHLGSSFNHCCGMVWRLLFTINDSLDLLARVIRVDENGFFLRIDPQARTRICGERGNAVYGLHL